MNQPLHRIEVSGVEVDGLHAMLFYDIVDNVLIDDLTDYTVALSDDEQLDHKTITNLSYDLRRFWEFLNAGSKRIGVCTDEDIASFRDSEFNLVMSSSKSKRKSRVAQTTVNSRLRWIYRLIAWLQIHSRIPGDSIGERGCRVRSSLMRHEVCRTGVSKQVGSKFSRIGDRHKYPMLYRNVGGSSKHATKFVPSEDIRYSAISYMHEAASSDYLAHRNTLFIDIANAVGWRRASINSISIKEIIDASDVRNEYDYVSLCPSVQKFGYVETFDVPVWLVERMAHFIKNYMRPLAEQRRWKINFESSPLFLSVNGKPLKDRTITQIVSKAMRSIGAPPWASVHSYRRKFANDEIADETSYRLAKGLDTSAASISASVSLRLGQHSPDSIYPYVSKSLTTARSSLDEARRDHVNAIEQENIKLKELLKELGENHSFTGRENRETSNRKKRKAT